MNKGRLEAFSDGVLAVIITIMVLELRAPNGSSLAALRPLLPTFLCYVLSFIYLAIYWNNHHHLFQATQRVNGATLWANLHLLFWLSLIPFTTAWMADNRFAAWPVVLYGLDLLLAGAAYSILVRTLLGLHGHDSALGRAIGGDRKGKISVALYAVALPLTLLSPSIPCLIYVAVAAIWLIPDRRLERPGKMN